MTLLHMASLTLLVAGLLPLFTCGQLSSEEPKSYLTSNSYSRYPQWIVSDRALLQFSFKTSELTGLLMYMESTGAFGDYLKLSLVGGALAIEVLETTEFVPIVTTIGEQLNDNQLHSVEIDHESDAQFHISLDGSSPVTVPYVPLSVIGFPAENIAFSGLYFGGFPDISAVGSSTARTDTHFAGCLLNIRYSNDSTNPGDLVPQFPLAETDVTDNCTNPCEGVNCGSGICVQRFPVGFCDCRGTDMLGPNCDEDPTAHQRTFTEEGQYLCYDNTRRQPYTGEQTAISLIVLPPLPTTGTIMTGVSNNLEYTIAIQDGNFVYKLIRNQVVIASMSIPASSLSAAVRMEASVNRSFVTFTAGQLNSEEMSAAREMDLALNFNPDFENICLGGVELEGVNYAGPIQSAYSDYFSLTEERNFVSLEATPTERSNVINFDIHQNQGVFEFQHSHTNATKIAFDMRTSPGESFHLLQLRNNGGDTITLTIFSTILVAASNIETHQCMYNVEEGNWHHFELFVTRDPPKIEYTVDCRIDCVFATEFIGGIDQFFSNPVRFGIDITTDGGFPLPPFPVCFQNIVFEDASGNVFRPNLEALARTGTTFSNAGCFNCTMDQESICPPGSCQYRDFVLGGECEDAGQLSPNVCPRSNDTTTPTMEITPTATTPTQTTQPPSTISLSPHSETTPTATTPTQTTQPPSTISPLTAGVIVGIAIGSIAALVFLVLMLTLIVFLCWRVIRGCTARGFYRTYETNEKNTSALRYSASLRELSSEVVLVESNGQVPTAGAMQSNGGHSKEFYL